MNEDDLKLMLDELDSIEQVSLWAVVLWRWLRRPRRRWVVSEMYPVIYVLG